MDPPNKILLFSEFEKKGMRTLISRALSITLKTKRNSSIAVSIKREVLAFVFLVPAQSFSKLHRGLNAMIMVDITRFDFNPALSVPQKKRRLHLKETSTISPPCPQR